MDLLNLNNFLYKRTYFLHFILEISYGMYILTSRISKTA